jgi:hypothetical protein
MLLLLLLLLMLLRHCAITRPHALMAAVHVCDLERF